MNFKRKLWWAQHRTDVYKYSTIILLFLIVTISIIYFTYSKFSSSNEATMYETTVEPFIKNDYFIASYIDGEWSNEIPGKNDGYIVDKIVCDNGAVGTWDYNDWRIYIDNATKKIKCGVYFVKGMITDFDYFIKPQVFIAPNAGTYKLEVWGAQGGSGAYRTLKTIGGYGGYSTGIVKLNKDAQLYIYTGGTTTDYLGGFNGGGNGNYDETGDQYRIVGGGGGATHIATKTGTLSSLENSKDSILIVAGGGSGGANTNNGHGGHGGGYIGNDGYAVTSTSKFIGHGGTQTSGGNGYAENGKFGQGGKPNVLGANGNERFYSSGGGGGLYGGSAGDWSYDESLAGSGGGGSGYIGNSLITNKSMYCYNCKESNAESTKTITTTCVSETPISNCAKKGNGYVRITYIG